MLLKIKNIFLFFVLSLVSVNCFAAISVTVDVNASGRDASTGSNKIYVERIELSFPNNRASQTVNQYAKGLYAKAKFKYLGNGPLIIRWKVDGRVISQTSEILTFGKEVEIRSDKNRVFLPTFERGTHVVTLVLSNSAGVIDVDVPSIKYFVADGVSGIETDSALNLMFPSDEFVAPKKVYFRWQGQAVFKAYIIEVQRIASKTLTAKKIIKAITDVDVYSPSNKIRSQLLAADYRWRITASYQDKNLKPLVSKWEKFSIAEGEVAGGLFISNISTVVPDALKVNTGESEITFIPNNLQIKRRALNNDSRLNSSLNIVTQTNVTAGRPYELAVELQNFDFVDAKDTAIEVYKGSELIGRYPLNAKAGDSTTVSILLDAQNYNLTEYQNINIAIVKNDLVVDRAAINLTIEPALRLDALNFEEMSAAQYNPVSIKNGCVNNALSSNSAFSRMVAAQGIDTPTQSLLEQGSFTFEKYQDIQFTAYIKDNGLGRSLASARQQCNQKSLSALQENVRNGNAFNLQFIARRLNEQGQIIGDAIEIGQVTIENDSDGLVKSPFWRIPNSGQYLITLNDISEPADLYATNENGMPKYIHASGFVLTLSEIKNGSTITNLNPRQAIINATATSLWAGDSAEQEITFDLNSTAVEMTSNPLHGVLRGGEIVLTQNTEFNLRLQNADITLKALSLSINGALADIEYRLPGYSNFNSVINSVGNSSSNSRDQSNSQSYIKVNFNGNIVFNKLEILNGGEFVARYTFDNLWGDYRISNDDLAIRLKGSTLVIDASKHFSYTDYTKESEFTGLGFYNTILRIKVNGSNKLFSLIDPENAYIYARANWLDYANGSLSGEDIKVLPENSVADFFNQKVNSEFKLLQPFGFTLSINSGVFSLENSKVGGLNFAGSVALPENENTSVFSNYEFVFNNLTRYENDTNSLLFTTEKVEGSSINFSIGVFDYQPEKVKLNIGYDKSTRQLSEKPSPTLSQVSALDESLMDSLNEQLNDSFGSFGFSAGLMLTDGDFSKGWIPVSNDEDLFNSDDRYYNQHRGQFLINASGLHGQWFDSYDTYNYLTSTPEGEPGFEVQFKGVWLSFADSTLIDSHIAGVLKVPYPVYQSFNFTGKLSQQASFKIASGALTLADNQNIRLDYWHATLYPPASDNNENTVEPNIGLNVDNNIIANNDLTSKSQIQNIIFDNQNQRIQLRDMGLSLNVDETSYGGNEFISLSAEHPFTVSTFILPNGQLENTVIKTNGDIQFVGQVFEPDADSALRFLPYIGNNQKPNADVSESALPLVEINGDLIFSVFGKYSIKIEHTAVGARVPEISRAPGINEYWGEDAVRVKADLSFVNTYSRNADALQNQVNDTTGESAENINIQPFKAFVGKADLVIINAMSIKGLAEAGVHQQEKMQRDGDGKGKFVSISGADKVAYERIGLGAGVDILKATVAGVRSLETATKFIGGAVTDLTGVEGAGKKVVDLGVDATTFIQSVAVAAGVAYASGGAAAVDEIRNAIDNGLSTTNSGIELLKLICEQQPECLNDTSMQLDVASLFVRMAGGVAHFDQLTEQEIASIGLQGMDLGIPILQGIPLANSTNSSPVNNIKNASLSAAHVVVGSARTLVDNNGRISFPAFLNISRRAVKTAEDLGEIDILIPSADAKKLLSLSISVANESINIAEGFSANANAKIDITKLSAVTNKTLKLMCSQADNLSPLFRAANLDQGIDEFIKPMMNFSSQILNKIERDGLPANAEKAAAIFLINVLTSLSESSVSIEGCDATQMQALPAVQAILKIAVHSLQPMKGELKNEGQQIAWALDGVRLSVDAVNSLSQQLNGTQFPQTEQIKGVLQKLSATFSSLQTGLSSNQNNASGQTVIRLAQGIPAAFEDLLATGSPQAAELMDVYVALMRELEVLMSNADKIAANELEGVDLFALPLTLIDEVQDLSLLNQCQKYALVNLTKIISMSREAAKDKPSMSQLVGNASSVFNNIKRCDQSGFTNNQELEKLMSLLELAAALSDNSAQSQSIIKQSLPQLLPLFVDGSVRMLDSIQAFVMALPIIDFTQDNLSIVLDDTLIKLLNEAESRNSDAQIINAIRKARSIISYADFNLIGISLNRDDAGNIISMKQVRADGSVRFYDFSIGWFKQTYPQDHPEYMGGIDELYSDGNFTYDNLSANDKLNMFTENWNNEYKSGLIHIRKYKDAAGNTIYADNSTETNFVKIIDAVSYGSITTKRFIEVDELPAANTAANDIAIDKIWSASFYVADTDSACPFSGGCVFNYESNSTILQIQSVVNRNNFASYAYNESDEQWAVSLNEIRPTEQLMEFNGHIISTENNWNPLWNINYRSDGIITVNLGESFEIFDVGENSFYENPSELISAIDDQSLIMLRRVINGNDIWDYNFSNKQAVHSFGDAQWAVYALDQFLANGSAKPAPDTLIDMSTLELLFEGDKNGIKENETLPGVPANMLVDGNIQIPAENAEDVIVIALNGSNAGSVMLGGLPIEIAALNTSESATSDGDAAMSNRPRQEDGSYLVNRNDGSSDHYIGSNADNLKVIRSTDSFGLRQVKIKFCVDATKSLSLCSASQTSYFELEYILADNNEIFYFPARPVITPASGVNQAIKHQLWLDVFELERQLKITPSEDLLTQLKSLIESAKLQGISASELDDQHKHIAGSAIQVLIKQQFELHENNISNAQQIEQWSTNPATSPAQKIQVLIKRAELFGLKIAITANNFNERFFELLVLNYRSQLHKLNAVNISNADSNTLINLTKNIQSFTDTATQMAIARPNDPATLTEMNSVVCQKVDAIQNSVLSPMVNDPNRIIFEDDLKLALSIENLSFSYFCVSDESTMLADISALSQRVIIESDEIRIQVSGLMLETKILNQGSSPSLMSTADLLNDYLLSIWRVDQVTGISVPPSSEYHQWIEQIQLLNRASDLIKTEEIRRRNNNQAVYFFAPSVTELKENIASQLKRSWEDEWKRLFQQFIDAKTQDITLLKALAKHHALSENLNSSLKTLYPDGFINVDTEQFLRANIENIWFSPINKMSDQQQTWIDGIWLTNSPAIPSINTIRENLNQQDEVIEYLQNQVSSNKLGNLKTSQQLFTEKLNSEMDQLETALARPNIGDIIDDVIKPIGDIDKLLTSLQNYDLQTLMDQRVQALLDQSIERVKVSSGNVLDLELKKIIAIQTLHNGNLGGIVGNEEVLAAIDNACTNRKQAMQDNSSVDDLSYIRDFMSIAQLQASLGVEQAGDCELAEVAPVIGALADTALAELVSTNDLTKINDYYDLEALAQGFGVENTTSNSDIIDVINFHRDELFKCVGTKSCTANDLKRYIDLSAQSASIGDESSDMLTNVAEMVSSSPITFPASIEHESDLPALDKLVKQDETGAQGRELSAEILKVLGNALDMADANARKAIRSILNRLQRLANLQLPSGFTKPVQANDPLFNAADILQLKFDNWLQQATQQLTDALSENPGMLVTDSPENSQSIIESLGLTLEEIDELLLPQINGSPTEQRIMPGNKYRLAANALEAISDLNNDAFINLSYRILKNIPDPQITTEADYRLAGIAQLTTFIFSRSGELIAGTGETLSATDIKKYPAGNVLFTLLSLPNQTNPVRSLITVLETEMISPLVNDDNASLSCAQGVGQCVLGSGLKIIAVTMDSFIATTQQSNANSNNTVPNQANGNQAAGNQVSSKQQKLTNFLKILSQQLVEIPIETSPEAFWFNLSGEGLSISLMMLEQNTDIQTQVAVRGLSIANKLLRYAPVDDFVNGLTQPVPMAFYFVRDSSEFLQQQLSQTNDTNLPVAMARLAQGAVYDTMKNIDKPLADIGNELMDWQLDFADAKWSLISNAASGQVNAQEWVGALLSGEGIASLNCRVNKMANLSIPPAFSLMPFVVTQSLLNNQQSLGDKNKSPKVLAELSADMSNLWFSPIEVNACDDINVPSFSQENDKPVAALLRQLGNIDPTAKANIASVQLVGNLGIGAISALLPNTSLSNVMSLIWNGNTDDRGTGISDFLVLAMEETTPIDVLTLVEKVQFTSIEVVDVLLGSEDPTAKMMRILSGNVTQDDLTAPDILIGTGQGSTGRAYMLPNSILAILGSVRESIRPLSPATEYVTNSEWGYLQTVPFISLQNGVVQISAESNYVSDMQEMLNMATQLDAANTLGSGVDVVQKVMIAGADIARLGISGIAPLINPDLNNRGAVAAIQQRSMFSDLAGENSGFSGLSGGYQREWALGTNATNSFTLEMYGQLVFPLMGTHVGLFEYKNVNGINLLEFNAATDGGVVGDFVGGITGGLSAQVSVDAKGALGMIYEGTSKLEILSNTIANIGASGMIGHLNVTNDDNLPIDQYAKKLVENISILQCASVEGQVLPFPLSLTGVSATATAGGFLEKTSALDDPDLSVIYGSRAGLRGSLKFPLINSLLGITLGGDLTSAYSGSINPINNSVALSNQMCVNPRIELTLLGQRFSLSGFDAKVEGFVEGNATDVNAIGGLKMQISIDSDAISAMRDVLQCDEFNVANIISNVLQNVDEEVAKQFMCGTLGLSSDLSMWLVLRNQSNPVSSQMILGFGELPQKNSSNNDIFLSTSFSPVSSFGDGAISPPAVIFETQAGKWGGWRGSKNIDLCNRQLCDMNQFGGLQ